MYTINPENILKQTVKKIVKSGYFRIIDFNIKRQILSFQNVHDQIFSIQPDPLHPSIGMLFSAGYVEQWSAFEPTFESEYNKLGMVEKAIFKPFLIQNTDNPDFILRNAKAITLNLI